ncbi:beta-lactamase-like protein [Peziza echinospora]|nr:beta-lactamase-like protein [Peziza echinospora]
MSTFRGIVAEFPDIRIDYFRLQPNAPPALACFLSHIHSDHLQGLEGYYGGPFIYCSEATKELLIRLERRAHRVNYAKQLVEARSFTHAEKRSVLRTIPLETPTWIELGNGKRIKVTLFDANHCPGAVMFLIENEVHSILYTGDIRAEPWWVEYVARHPVLIPYTMGIRRLSCIYLDTSFYAYRDQTTETFNTKAEGIRELISTMLKYPKDTTFHFNTWTFGYEDVWVAMAAALDEKIHVDRYQHRLFRSIRDKRVSSQGPFLNGYAFGNTSVEGKLTNDPSARIHSCDRNLECEGLKGKKVVWIVPLVNRVGGVEVNEVGIGQGDLESHSELSLDDKSLEFIMGALGSRMTLEAREMLRLANHSRSEALPLEWGTEEKITFALLNKLLGEIAGARKREEEVRRREMGLGLGLGGTGSRAQAEEVKRLWESKIGEHVVADDGELLPTRIVCYPYFYTYRFCCFGGGICHTNYVSRHFHTQDTLPTKS